VSENTSRNGFATSDDVRIHFRAFGKPGKTPVVIVHGMSYFSYDWTGIAQRLADEREVAALDQRGFGDSDWSPTRKYDLRQQASDVIAVLDHLGWKQAVLMGHSAGGRICLCAASWYPERARALVSVDFAPDLAPAGRRKVAEQIGRQPDVFSSVDEVLQYHKCDPALPADAPTRKRFEAFLNPVAGGYALKRDLHYRNQFKQVLDTGKSHPPEVDAWALLKEVKIPLLVIRASGSDLFAPETMDKVRASNGCAEVVQIEGGHDLARDNPDELSKVVRGFLTSVG
jgi:pimeloyl-ACP methyl ester carboxylesterase